MTRPTKELGEICLIGVNHSAQWDRELDKTRKFIIFLNDKIHGYIEELRELEEECEKDERKNERRLAYIYLFEKILEFIESRD